MNITSMLSSGYLKPLFNVPRSVEPAEKKERASAVLSAREAVGDERASFMSGISSVKAGLLFELLHGEGYASPIVDELPDNTMLNPAEAYGRNASPRGLWTLRLGYEPALKTAILKPRFDIAA